MNAPESMNLAPPEAEVEDIPETPLKPVSEMEYHPLSEQLVGVLRDHMQRDDSLFFRLLVGYYFCLAATQMRTTISMPEGDLVPPNLYVLNLAPSGYGKTRSMNLMEEKVLNMFRRRFEQETLPIMAEANIDLLGAKRALRNGTDPADEIKSLAGAYKIQGPPLFSFDSATSPAIKQMRHKLLVANVGALNLIMDEVGDNLEANREAFSTFLELYDKGYAKTKLIKSTRDSVRDEEILGSTPSNLMMFGVPVKLFDGDKTEDSFMSMLASGYARRCFFGYIRHSIRRKMTAREMYLAKIKVGNHTFLDGLSQQLENLADPSNVGKQMKLEEPEAILLNKYQNWCEDRAELIHERQENLRRELSERVFKVLKLAGGYAFIESAVKISEDHIYAAIKLAEDSGEAFNLMLNRDRPFVKLAKYIATMPNEVTHADLAEDLHFYKGSLSVKQDMLTLAMAWGYTNNIIIKKSFQDGIEFFRGETLKETDFSKMIVAYSEDWTEGYLNQYAPFDRLHKLTQTQNLHWVSHHLKDGYRNEENAIPGFNLVVIDVDGGTTIETAKLLLKDYKFLLYTTKSHSEREHCFRIVLPINFELKLDAKDYREFMQNVYKWLPFECDTATGQRARKWLCHEGHHEYNDGLILDALPFIPKTSKNEEYKTRLNTQQSMDNLERWTINNIGDGNRNNMLFRYASILVDAGLEFEGIRQKVMSLNGKIPDSLDEAEVMTTVMVSVAKALAKR